MFENWVGRLSTHGKPPARVSGNGAGFAPSTGSRAQYRRMIVADIGEFLIAHDLDLSAFNFELAREIVTGHDVRLGAAVQQLLSAGDRLTNVKAQEIVAAATPGRLTPEALMGMLGAVEAQADALFGSAARSHDSVRDYGSALESHAATLTRGDTAGDAASVVTRLVALTLGMVERAGAIEAEMRESQKQAKRLKKSLDRARHAADHDALTGLPNRRAFERLVNEEAARARDGGTALSVAFCDVDHFKAINDGHGHATGDRVLCFIADLLARASGNRCHVARHGGEEFVMLFPGLTPEAALMVVDAARQKLSERRLIDKATGERMAAVTFSAGIADIAAHPSAGEGLAAADAALYAAKQAGRNRALLAQSPAQLP